MKIKVLLVESAVVRVMASPGTTITMSRMPSSAARHPESLDITECPIQYFHIPIKAQDGISETERYRKLGIAFNPGKDNDLAEIFNTYAESITNMQGRIDHLCESIDKKESRNLRCQAALDKIKAAGFWTRLRYLFMGVSYNE